MSVHLPSCQRIPCVLTDADHYELRVAIEDCVYHIHRASLNKPFGAMELSKDGSKYGMQVEGHHDAASSEVWARFQLEFLQDSHIDQLIIDQLDHLDWDPGVPEWMSGCSEMNTGPGPRLSPVGSALVPAVYWNIFPLLALGLRLAPDQRPSLPR